VGSDGWRFMRLCCLNYRARPRRGRPARAETVHESGVESRHAKRPIEAAVATASIANRPTMETATVALAVPRGSGLRIQA